MLNKDGSPAFTWDPPPADLVANTKALLRQGKPMIFLHHASASWAHSWPEFTEVMGIACDWGQPLRVRGVDHPKSGYFQNTKQRITVVDKAHPITQGLGDGFEIVDEVVQLPDLRRLSASAAAHRLHAERRRAESEPAHRSSATSRHG